ncbi:MAG: thioesterase family protein [Myxococcaceae bacterium]
MLTSYLARLALTTSSSFIRPKAGALDEVRTPMHVWLSDIDINGHINNGRYLTLMDFARLDHSIRTGLATAVIKKKWWPVLGAATVKFRRELKPLEKFEIVTKVGTWDQKWMFIEHRFERAGNVHTIGFVKAVVRKGRETIPPSEVMALIGHHDAAPLPSDELAQWIATQR